MTRRTAAIDAFGVQLRDEVDLAAVHGHLLAAAEATVQPASAAVWLREREAAR